MWPEQVLGFGNTENEQFLIVETKQRRRQRIEVPDSDFKPELAQTAMPVVYTEQNRIVDEKKRESEKVVDRVSVIKLITEVNRRE